MELQFRAKYELSKITQIALHCLRLIRDRTQDGLDVNDMPFKAYSTRTFKMPVSNGTKRALGILKSQGDVEYRILGGVKYAIVKGGYLNYKRAYIQSSGNSWNGKVDLTMTGAMLRDLNVIETSNNSFKLGFTNIEMSQRALKNIDRGRDFLGLSPKNMQDSRLIELLGEGLQLEVF